MDANFRFPVAKSSSEGSNANSSLRQTVTRRPCKCAQRGRFAPDSLLEGDGFELPVPEREDRVSSLGLLLARDRGVGADVSVQPGFVIIMPSPLEASGAALLFSGGP